MIAHKFHAGLLSGVAAGGLLGLAAEAAVAQDDDAGLEEIVVTAQRRWQSLQDVPVSVTALTEEALKANRIVDVRDLSSVAPNLTVRTATGGAQIPGYTLRGLYALGATAGTDKGVALYIDGVYVQNALGSIFQLAEIEQIEVLKGPQGTLFGRNSTAGAISLTTRQPAGEFGVEQTLTYGNYNQFRSKTRIDSPALGALTASATYMHSERDGDTRNLGGGTRWDYGPATNGKRGVLVSPNRLGDEDTDAVMVALRLDPGKDVLVDYKFDYTKSNYTPEANGASILNTAAFPVPSLRPLLNVLILGQSNPAILTPLTTTRPDAVNNWFTTPGETKVEGHNLTATFQASDNIALKNILAYRKVDQFSTYELDGYGGLRYNVAPFLGPGAATDPFVLYGNATAQSEKQWSEEFLVNADTSWMHLTFGYIHFDNRTKSGTAGLGQAINLSPVPNFIIPRVATEVSRYKAVSDAIYAQPEFHITDQLDFVIGGRYTRDKKSEDFRSAIPFFASEYENKKPTYIGGVNYKVSDDVFTYVKYSTGYISGGSVSGEAYQPELAKSWEAGVKADFFENRWRSNLALWSVQYSKLQYTVTGRSVNKPTVASLIINGADSDAKGFEWENTLLPIEGLTLTLNVGYTDFKLKNQNPVLGPPTETLPGFQPELTGSSSIQYEIGGMPRNSDLVMRVDANYKSKEYLGSYLITPATKDVFTVDPTWIINARIALRDFNVMNSNAELALWGRNLTDEDRMKFAAPFPYVVTGSYERARTYGVDVSFNF
jgi:iron complex outermembrane receptor protein